VTGDRTYVVGLPVVVQIDATGHVSVEVDTAELGSRKVLAEQSDYDDQTIRHDAEYLATWTETHRVIGVAP